MVKIEKIGGKEIIAAIEANDRYCVCAVEKTPFVKTADGKHYKKINFKSIIGNVKKELKDKYSLIQAGVADAAIKKQNVK